MASTPRFKLLHDQTFFLWTMDGPCTFQRFHTLQKLGEMRHVRHLSAGTEYEVLAVEGWTWKVQVHSAPGTEVLGFIEQPKLYRRCEIEPRSNADRDGSGASFEGLWKVLGSTEDRPVGVECLEGSLRGSLVPWEKIRILYDPLPLGQAVLEDENPNLSNSQKK